jgi:hypothetical protein
MKLAEGIRRHGFRKWYERELLQSHAHLVLTFLCLVGLFAAFEGAWRYRDWGDAAAGLACAAVGMWALRRYLRLLTTAEAVASQADCPRCKTYGRLELLRSDATGSQVQVRCRHCAAEWELSSGE